MGKCEKQKSFNRWCYIPSTNLSETCPFHWHFILIDSCCIKSPQHDDTIQWKRLSVDGPLASCPPCQYYCQKTWHHAMTTYDVVTLHHTTSYDMTKWTCTGQPIWKSENHIFQPSDLDLDQQTYSRYCQAQSLHQILSLYVQRFSQESADRHTVTHTQMGPIPYPRTLTREGMTFHEGFKLLSWTILSLYCIWNGIVCKTEVLKLSVLSVLSDMDT